MADSEIRINPTDTTNEVASAVHSCFLASKRVTIFTDDANQYNLAVKAAAIVRRELLSLGVDLVCGTFFQNSEGRYQDRCQLKLVLSDKH